MNIKRLVDESVAILVTNIALARYLKCNERTIYRWLAGESKPKHDYTIKMYELIMKHHK